LPVITPEELTVAIADELVVHDPPLMPLLKLMVEFTHTADGPLMVPALGSGLTVISADAVAIPQLVVTV
jgi:hypothetical protein